METIYIVNTHHGYLTFDDVTRKVTHTENPDDAAIFSRIGAVRMAMVHGGQAYSYNYDTRKLRAVNA
jgi:hypothetical protein